MIKRNYLKHGDIIEICLGHEWGFGYAKVVDPRKLQDPFEYPLILRIYDFNSKSQIISTNSLSRDLLMAPIWISHYAGVIKRQEWTIIANEPIFLEEEFIPHTKQSWPPLLPDPKKWGYYKKFDTHMIFEDYEKVKHLDYKSGYPVEIIAFVIKLELNKKYQKGNIMINNWLEQVYFDRRIDLPVFSKLDQELQGRVKK